MTLSASATKAEIELRNALRADEFVYDLAREDQELSASFVREINRHLLLDVVPEPGAFRRQNVQISGARFQPPDFGDIDFFLRSAIDMYKGCHGVEPLLQSAWLHATFTRIHPFVDGNGRTGRLLQDFVLLRSGLYPTGIPSSKRDDYYDALELADGGEFDRICQLIAQLELRLVARVSAVVEEVRNRGQFVSIIVAKARQKKSGTLHKKYVVWQQRMATFIELLQRTCDEINRASDVLQVLSEVYPIIDFDKWKSVVDTGRADGTWAIKQNWLIDGEQLYRTIMYFSRHTFRSEDIFPRETLHGLVGLRLTGGKPSPGVKFDFAGYSDPLIRFRELLFVEDTLHVFRFRGNMKDGRRGNEESWECVDLLDQSVVVKELIEDVFLRKLGLSD